MMFSDVHFALTAVRQPNRQIIAVANTRIKYDGRLAAITG